MQERLWLKVTHLRLFDWLLHDYGGGATHILFTLSLGDFQTRKFHLTPSGVGVDAFGTPNTGGSGDHIGAVPADYKLAGVPVPDLILGDLLVEAIWRHFRQPQNWGQLREYYNGGQTPYEVIIAPEQWGGQALWIPVDFVEIFNLLPASTGLYADIRMGHHLLFREQLLDRRYKSTVMERPHPGDWQTIDRLARSEEELFEEALLRRTFTNPRVNELIEAATQHAWDSGMWREYNRLRFGHSKGREHYLYGVPGVDPGSVAPGLVMNLSPPPSVVAA
ncbi:hypothetical protein EPO04_00535 [Patescibacteria group bacterium]|nr:MAG: hypothetical protein EPO04_00535 [Patescibacteria group bacterium]